MKLHVKKTKKSIDFEFEISMTEWSVIASIISIFNYIIHARMDYLITVNELQIRAKVR